MVELWLKNKKQAEALPYFQTCKENQHFTNLEFICKGGQRIFGHMFLLSAFSRYLNALLLPYHKESKAVLMLPDFNGLTVEKFMTFLYTGVVTLNNAVEQAQFLHLADIFKVELPVAEWSPSGTVIVAPQGIKRKAVKEVNVEDEGVAQEVSPAQKAVGKKGDLDEFRAKRQKTGSSTKYRNSSVIEKVHSTSNKQAKEQTSVDSIMSTALAETNALTVEEMNLESDNENQDGADNEPKKKTDEPTDDVSKATGSRVTKRKKDDPLECIVCNEEFSCLSKILYHFAKTHCKEELSKLYKRLERRCNICNLSFNSPMAFADHIGVLHKAILVLLEQQGHTFFAQKLRFSQARFRSKQLTVVRSLKQLEPIKPVEEVFLPMDDEQDVDDPASVAPNESGYETPNGSNQGGENTEEETDEPAKKKVPMPLCVFCGNKFTSGQRLLMHIVLIHFRTEYKEMYQKHSGMCHVCDKFPPFEEACKYAKHMGVSHKLAFSHLLKAGKGKYVEEVNDCMTLNGETIPMVLDRKVKTKKELKVKPKKGPQAKKKKVAAKKDKELKVVLTPMKNVATILATQKIAASMNKDTTEERTDDAKKRKVKKTPIKKGYRSVVFEKTPPCFECGKDFGGKLSKFLTHLSSKFSEKFRPKFKEDKGKCYLCFKKFGNFKDYFTHMGSVHKLVLDYVPDDFRRKLEDLFESRSKLRNQKPDETDVDEDCGLDEEKQSVDTENGEQVTEDEIGQIQAFLERNEIEKSKTEDEKKTEKEKVSAQEVTDVTSKQSDEKNTEKEKVEVSTQQENDATSKQSDPKVAEEMEDNEDYSPENQPPPEENLEQKESLQLILEVETADPLEQ